MSDHKLIKVTRFARSFRQNPRYIRKRIFKDFNDKKFQQKLEESNLDEILSCTDVNDATKILVDKISKVLDEMAPIKTIQTRTNYVPWLSEDTKGLQQERDDAQKKASHTDDPEDWRLFRSLRNLLTYQQVKI